VAKFSKTTAKVITDLLEGSKQSEPWSMGSDISSGVPLSPHTNRGVENTKQGLEFKCDWFSVTIHHGFDQVFANLVPLLLSDSGITDFHWSELFHDVGHGGRGYKRLWTSPIGVTLYAQPINKNQNHCHIELKGSALDNIGQGRFVEFAQTIAETYEKWNCTRFDGAYDHSEITPYMMDAAARSGMLRTHCRCTRLDQSTTPAGTFATHYVGNRKEGSERLMRVYDRRGYNRLELELRKKRADLVFKDLLLIEPEQWPMRFMEHLRDFVDVINVDTGSGNRSRAGLISWWGEFVRDASKAGMRLDTVDTSLDKSKEWIERSVVTSLAMLLESGRVDNEWLFNEIERGRAKMSPRQQLLAQTYHFSAAEQSSPLTMM